MSTSPHDASFKPAFGQPEIAQRELESLLPAELREQLDWASLEVAPGSFVDDDLRATHSDLLYAMRTTAGNPVRLYFLFEHQSTFDGLMPLRLLRYMVRVWERYVREHPNATLVPLVVPVVLHHGRDGWRASTHFDAMFDATPELLDAVHPFVPTFRFLLDDIGQLSLDALAARTLSALTRLVQLAFWSSRSLHRLREAAPAMQEMASSVSRDERTRALLKQLYLYLLCSAESEVDARDVRTILLQVAGIRIGSITAT